MRFFTDLGRGLFAASALAALQVASSTQAQYTPYPQTAPSYPQMSQAATQPAAQPSYPQSAPPVYSQSAPSYAQPAPQQQAYAPQQQQVYAPQQQAQAAQPQPRYSAQPPVAAPAMVYQQYAPPQGFASRPTAVAAQPFAAPAQSYAPAQPYGQQPPYSPPRIAMFRNQDPAAGPQDMPLDPPAENIAPGPASNGAYMPQPSPGMEDPAAASQGSPYAYPADGAAQNGACNGQPGYESYPSSAYGYGGAYGACSPYSTYGHDHPGAMGRLLGKHGGGYWFGGAYGLLMERDNGDKVPLTFATAAMPPGDYPPSDAVVLTTRNVDIEYMGGVEFRLGRTFGGGYDACDPSCSCGPTWGLESVYWTLFEDDATAEFSDNGSVRVYTMLDPRGLEYDHGAGWRPVRHYWDYAPPAEDYTDGGLISDVEVRVARVRSSFEVHNVELNLLRLGVCGTGCGGAPAMYNVGCDSGLGGYDACSGGACDTRCAPACKPSRFSCTTVAGVRWMQFDEDFMYGVDFDIEDGAYPDPIDGSLNYWSVTENNLIGAQVGCNGMYRVGCKWGLHCNTLVGVYGNDIDVRQYMVSPTGLVRFIDTGENFDVTASKTDVAMMGEVRLGASYQATRRLRLYGGWRAIGVSGIALATDQAPSSFISAAQLANYVNSNGSLILHGLQTGLEWNY